MQQQAGSHMVQPAVPIDPHHLQQQQQQQALLHEQPVMSSHTPYSINQSGFTPAPAITNPFVRQQQPANQIALYQQPRTQNFMQQSHSFQQQPFGNVPQDNTNMGMGQTFMQQQNQFPGQQGVPGYQGQQQPGFQGQQQSGFQGQQQSGFQGQQQMPGYQGQPQQQQPGYQGQQMPGQQQFNQQQQPMQNQMGGASDQHQMSSEAKQQHSELKQELTKVSGKMDDLMGKVRTRIQEG